MDLIKTISRFIIVMTVILIGGIFLFAGDSIRTAAPFVVWTLAGTFVLAILVAAALGLDFAWLFARNYHAGKNKDHTLLTNEAKQSTLDLERARLHLGFERQALGAQAEQMAQGLVFATSLGEAAFGSHAAAVAKLIQNGNAAPYLESQPLNLLDVVGDLENLLIVGGKGSGKTTLLQHLEAMRLASGRTIVLDSHAQPAQWRGETIGMGRQYSKIKNAMVGLVDKLNRRYEKWSKGQSNFEPICTFIDEFTLLPKQLKAIDYNVQNFSFPILTEGRKVSIQTIWGIHSDRATALGLEGAADLKECFDCVIYLKNTNEGRYALVDYGEGKQDTRYKLPGPFVVNGDPAQPLSLPESVVDSAPMDSDQSLESVDDSAPEPEPAAEPTEQEMAAIMGFVTVRDSGKFSWNKATQAALGEGKVGKNYHAKLKRILDKFNIDYSELTSK